MPIASPFIEWNLSEWSVTLCHAGKLRLTWQLLDMLLPLGSVVRQPRGRRRTCYGDTTMGW